MIDLYIHWHHSLKDDDVSWSISVDGIKQTVLNADFLVGRVTFKARNPFNLEEWRQALKSALADYKPRIPQALAARNKHDAERQAVGRRDEMEGHRLAALAAEIASTDKQTPPLRD